MTKTIFHLSSLGYRKKDTNKLQNQDRTTPMPEKRASQLKKISILQGSFLEFRLFSL
jgi:hypothetical protein